jgi:site-specific recombinase XerD
LYIGVNRFNTFGLKKQFVRKDKLSLADIAKIEALQVEGELLRARDMFLFSYYCKGMRFKNCYAVKIEDIRDGRVYFPRISKSYKDISIKIHSKLQMIISAYMGARVSGQLFNFNQKSASYNSVCNRNLKLIAAMCDIKVKLSFHISRHSFANNLKQMGTNINVIKDALGHSDVRITEVYLASLDDQVIDDEMSRLYGD